MFFPSALLLQCTNQDILYETEWTELNLCSIQWFHSRFYGKLRWTLSVLDTCLGNFCEVCIKGCIHTSINHMNSLAPGRFKRNFRRVNLQLILVIGGWSISCKIVLKWMPVDLTYGRLTLVQVMAWCHQATSHYLSKCWPRSMSPNGVTRPPWVKTGHMS